MNIVLILAVVCGIAIAILTLLGPSTSAPQFTCLLCSNSLDIKFEGFQPAEYRVEVSSPDIKTMMFTCASSTISNDVNYRSGCMPNGVHLNGPTPEEVTVKVTWDGGSKTETFHVSYETFKPTAPACDPECKRGTVTMTLP